MPALDIFSGSAFSMVALTDAINKMPYVPGRIGQLGLFREQGVSTTSVMIEEREGSLNLVETTARGAPAIQNTTNKRKARSLVVPHIALEDTILADEVQNVRAFGSESMLEGVQAVVNQRMSEMATKMDATLEHLRIGAIKGQILDADGSAVIYDLFTEFGVTQHTEIDFDLDNASPAPGAVKKKCHDIRRKVEDELGAQPYDHVHAICGADFFDDLITHSEVAKAYDRYLDGAFLRQGQARGSFEYSGIVFEESAAGSGRSTSPTRARRTSSRSGCRDCFGSTTRRPTSSRPPIRSACRATPSRRRTSSSPAGSCCACSPTRCRSARGRGC
jgi:hypothetical protein